MARIIRDTREKVGIWTFAGKRCKSKKLNTGDYSMEGYEDTVSLERKKSVTEISTNFTKDKVRFWAEMERLKEFKYPYVIFEFTMEEMAGFPWKSKLPKFLKRKIRARGPFLLGQVQKIEAMGIKVVFAGDRAGAIRIAEQIFAEVLANE